MHRLWNLVKCHFREERIRRNIFLILNTLVWSIGTFLIVMLGALLFLPSGKEMIGNVILTAGYAGVYIGFIGGCIFLMRNTPEYDNGKSRNIR